MVNCFFIIIILIIVLVETDLMFYYKTEEDVVLERFNVFTPFNEKRISRNQYSSSYSLNY